MNHHRRTFLQWISAAVVAPLLPVLEAAESLNVLAIVPPTLAELIERSVMLGIPLKLAMKESGFRFHRLVQMRSLDGRIWLTQIRSTTDDGGKNFILHIYFEEFDNPLIEIIHQRRDYFTEELLRHENAVWLEAIYPRVDFSAAITGYERAWV